MNSTQLSSINPKTTTLDLSNSKLTVLPESIGNLTNLTELSLESNELRTLPESIGNLTNLTTFDLNNNQLTVLPESIENLKRLTELNLIMSPISQKEQIRLKELFGNKVQF